MEDFVLLDHNDAPWIQTCPPGQLPSAIEDEVSQRLNMPTNIVVLGQYGAGKSSLIDALSNYGAIGDDTASVETPYSVQRNQKGHVDKSNPNIVFWNTNGYGITTTKDNLCLSRWDFADIYIFVSSTSRPMSKADFTTLISSIRTGKTVLFVHTKIDQDIAEFRSQFPLYDNDPKYLEKLRDMLKETLTSQGICDVPLFLLSSRYTHQWDFKKLRLKLDNELQNMTNQSINAHLTKEVMKRMRTQKRMLEREVDSAGKDAIVKCLKTKPMSYTSAFTAILTEKKETFERELDVKYPSDIIPMIMRKQKLITSMDFLRCVPLVGTVPFCIKVRHTMTQVIKELLQDGVEFAEQKWFAIIDETIQRIHTLSQDSIVYQTKCQ